MRKGFTKEFPTALYRLMILQNVSPAELMRQTGLGTSLVYPALHGKIPTLSTAYKLGRALGVSMHALLTDDFERMQKDLSFGMDVSAHPARARSPQSWLTAGSSISGWTSCPSAAGCTLGCSAVTG